ncbi:MAG TPA: hypothetical protein VHQ97_02345 [Solirubrobacterales bacterium]|jgi:hypothetical protein|nr:hypothetical protein [Solirubrobacterales bacterium]
MGLIALASLFAASPAFAIRDHVFQEEWVVTRCDESSGSSIEDIALDESAEILYVFCERGFGESPRAVIEKYDYEGHPVSFTASKTYVSGNEITGNPGNPGGTLESGFGGPHIAVDNSGGPHDGEIYVVTSGSGAFNATENIHIFRPSGEYAGAIEQPELIGGTSEDVDVGPDGSVYFLTTTRISKYNSGYNEVARMYTSGASTFSQGNRLVADNKGAVWNVQEGPVKFEPDQMFTNFTPAFGSNLEQFTGERSPYVPFPLESGLGSNVHIAIDPGPARDDLYVNRGNKIEVFSEGTAEQPSYRDAPTFGLNLGGGNGIAVTKDNHVFTTYFDTNFGAKKKIIVFAPGAILPDIVTDAADVEKVTHEGAELTGEVKLDGGTAITSCQLEVGPAKNQYTEPPVACTPGSFGTDSAVGAEISGLEAGTPYHYRFTATNEDGTNSGSDRVFTPAYVLKVKTLSATGVDENSAVLRGQLDPDGKDTSYYFEYGVTENYDLKTSVLSAGSTPGLKTVSTPIEGLPAGKVFHYRLVASNEDGTTLGEDQRFRTASTPSVYGLRATNLTGTSATLHATIDPVGYPTKYRFEYGPTSNYGESIPVPDAAIPTLDEPVEVEQTLTGLTPGITYHYRLVATSEPWGTSVSPDTTFDFAPPSCPNDHARQETGATFLPDCRGYELVSPGAAGAVQLNPGKIAFDLNQSPQDPLQQRFSWPLNNGLASSPPRLEFFGFLGTINGLRAPNLLAPDAYLATRTNTGWVTTLPGFDDSKGIPSLKECADTMNFCLEHNNPLEGNEVTESMPYVYNADGKFIERLPQNANLVPGANEYKGFHRVSGDFSNYVFSSRDTLGIFQSYPGAIFTVDGQTTGAGSAYDNDLKNRTVTLISRLPGSLGGGHIPQNGKSVRPIQFPGISGDGSHVLMMTEAGFDETRSPTGPPYHLYMRVDDAVSYDVSKGDATEFVGMTRDGSSVVFTSADQLTGDDEDSSVDLYRWEEATDSLTLLSVGNGAGNEDDCDASWTSGCNIEVPNTERRWPGMFQIGGNPNTPYFEGQGLDDLIAEENGDVYFYSPESLDGSKFGIANQRNLYVAKRNGQVQLVGSLDAGTQIYRMTIGRDGRFAAFLTNSQMTPYDNRGFRQVYTYDSDNGTLACASCRPGVPPTNNISVSQGGKFMADDGRTFFDTKDPLVPRDRNGEITDTYEYAGGRPQLISSGLASRDFTGESEIFSLFQAPETTGLEAVSRDGFDVYFSTFDTMVSEDHNGQFVKFYDARTNGGFAQPPVDAPCAAADECHGADSSPPTLPIVSSSVDLGTTGNHQQAKKKKKSATQKKKKAKKRKHRRQKHHRGRTNG